MEFGRTVEAQTVHRRTAADKDGERGYSPQRIINIRVAAGYSKGKFVGEYIQGLAEKTEEDFLENSIIQVEAMSQSNLNND